MKSLTWATVLHVTVATPLNKSAAVAEMGDRLATIDMGRKVGRAVVGGVGAQWVLI